MVHVTFNFRKDSLLYERDEHTHFEDTLCLKIFHNPKYTFWMIVQQSRKVVKTKTDSQTIFVCVAAALFPWYVCPMAISQCSWGDPLSLNPPMNGSRQTIHLTTQIIALSNWSAGDQFALINRCLIMEWSIDPLRPLSIRFTNKRIMFLCAFLVPSQNAWTGRKRILLFQTGKRPFRSLSLSPPFFANKCSLKLPFPRCRTIGEEKVENKSKPKGRRNM